MECARGQGTMVPQINAIAVLAGLELEYNDWWISQSSIILLGLSNNHRSYSKVIQTNCCTGKARNIDQLKTKPPKLPRLKCTLFNGCQKFIGRKSDVRIGYYYFTFPVTTDEPFTEMDSSGIELVCHYLRELQTTCSTTPIASPTPLPDHSRPIES